MESVETKHENGKVNDEKYYVESSMVGSSFEGYAQTFFNVSCIKKFDISFWRWNALWDHRHGINDAEESKGNGDSKIQVVIVEGSEKFASYKERSILVQF